MPPKKGVLQGCTVLLSGTFPEYTQSKSHSCQVHIQMYPFVIMIPHKDDPKHNL